MCVLTTVFPRKIIRRGNGSLRQVSAQITHEFMSLRTRSSYVIDPDVRLFSLQAKH